MRSLKLSTFHHAYLRNDAVALLNALRFRPVFLSRAAYEDFAARYLPEQAPFSRRSPSQAALSATIDDALFEASVLVPQELDEEAVLAEYQKSLTGHPAIHVCYLLLTDACNLRCTYCFIRNNLPSGYTASSMSPETAAAAVDFFHRAVKRANSSHSCEHDEHTLILYGGEPSLNLPAIETALRRANDLSFPGHLRIALITNGTLLDRPAADMLKQYNVGVSVSLDGPPRINDRWRNAGTYERAMKGLVLLREAGIEPGVSCTIPPDSLDDFDDILQWLDELGVRNIGFNLVTRPAVGFDSENYYSRATKLLIKAFCHFRQTGAYEDRVMRKVRSYIEGKPYPFDCAACGGAQVVVAPDGQVGICHAFLGQRRDFAGNVCDLAFRPENHRIWKEWSARSPLSIRECRSCACLGICGGGCPANNPENIFQLDRGFCTHAKTLLEWLVWETFEQGSLSS